MIHRASAEVSGNNRYLHRHTSHSRYSIMPAVAFRSAWDGSSKEHLCHKFLRPGAPHRPVFRDAVARAEGPPGDKGQQQVSL